MAITADQLNSLQKGATSLRVLIKITATDGSIIRALIGAEKVTFGGEEYQPAPIKPSDIEIHAGVDVSNQEFTTFLSAAFNALDLKGGKWQAAAVELMLIDVLKPEIGYIQKHKGKLGKADIKGRIVAIEFQGNTSLLAQETGWKTSRGCRYILGINDGLNSFCNVNLAAFTFTGTVGTVTHRQKFVISVSKADGYFYRGKITFTSGANIGLSMETTNNVGTLLTLFEPMPGTIAPGDTFSIIAGDDKTLSTCHNKFNSAIDHGGEDPIPETNKIFKVPD